MSGKKGVQSLEYQNINSLLKMSLSYYRKNYKYIENRAQFLSYIKYIIFSFFFYFCKKKDNKVIKLLFYNFFFFCIFWLRKKVVFKLRHFNRKRNLNSTLSFFVLLIFSFSKNKFKFDRIFRKYRLLKKRRRKRLKLKRSGIGFNHRRHLGYNYSYILSYRKGFFFLAPLVIFFINFFNFLGPKSIFLFKRKRHLVKFRRKYRYSSKRIYKYLNLNLNKFFLTAYLRKGKYLKNVANLQSLNDNLLYFLKNKIRLIEKVNLFFFIFHIKFKLTRKLLGKRFSEIMKGVVKQKEQSKLLLQFLFSEYYSGSKFFDNLALFFLDYRFENFIGVYQKKYLEKFNRGNCKYIFTKGRRKRHNFYARRRFGW